MSHVDDRFQPSLAEVKISRLVEAVGGGWSGLASGPSGFVSIAISGSRGVWHGLDAFVQSGITQWVLAGRMMGRSVRTEEGG